MASFEKLLMQHRFLTVVLAINTTVFSLIKWYNILMSCPHSQNWTMNDWTLERKMHCPQLPLHILPLLHMPRWNTQEPDGVDLEFVCNMIKSGFSKVTFIHRNWKAGGGEKNVQLHIPESFSKCQSLLFAKSPSPFWQGSKGLTRSWRKVWSGRMVKLDWECCCKLVARLCLPY